MFAAVHGSESWPNWTFTPGDVRPLPAKAEMRHASVYICICIGRNTNNHERKEGINSIVCLYFPTINAVRIDFHSAHPGKIFVGCPHNKYPKGHGTDLNKVSRDSSLPEQLPSKVPVWWFELALLAWMEQADPVSDLPSTRLPTQPFECARVRWDDLAWGRPVHPPQENLDWISAWKHEHHHSSVHFQGLYVFSLATISFRNTTCTALGSQICEILL